MARNPFEEIERMFDQMSHQFGTLDEELRSGSVAVDLVDAGDAYVVRADLPGYGRDEIDVEIAGDHLSISASRSDDSEVAGETDDGDYIRRERSKRSVDRSIRIPGDVDEEATEARYSDGVLTVELPKAHADEDGRDIPIN